MQTFRNVRFVKRDPECTNVVACVAETAPGPEWVPAPEEILEPLTLLYRQAGVAYFGHL